MLIVPNFNSQVNKNSLCIQMNSLWPQWIPFPLGAVFSLLSSQHHVTSFPGRSLCWCGFYLCYKALRFNIWLPVTTGKDFLVDSLELDNRLHL